MNRETGGEQPVSAMGSVSRQLAAVKAGDPDALAVLWSRYYSALLSLARNRLRDRGVRIGDEDDVVNQAFNSFFHAASQGHYPNLRDRNGLWRVLLTITANKAIDLIRTEGAQKHGGGHVLGEAALAGDSFESEAGFRNLISEDPTPGFAAMVAESVDQRLRALEDPVLRQIAILRMEGHENLEIAQLLKTSERTVERKLALIRKIWSAMEDGSSHVRR